MKVKEESENVGLKLDIQKTKASSPICSWQIGGKQWKQWQTIYLLGLQNRCRWWLHYETKRRLFLGRKAMTNLDSILKSRDMTLPTNVHGVKAMVSPVVMYGKNMYYEESWVQKNWWSWTVMWEKTSESPLDCKEMQPAHPKGHQSQYSLAGLMLKRKLQYFGHLIWRNDSLE